eukprot:scaffold290692_cov10-Tisochrysis_lutea.AAC.1
MPEVAWAGTHGLACQREACLLAAVFAAAVFHIRALDTGGPQARSKRACSCCYALHVLLSHLEHR